MKAVIHWEKSLDNFGKNGIFPKISHFFSLKWANDSPIFSQNGTILEKYKNFPTFSHDFPSVCMSLVRSSFVWYIICSDIADRHARFAHWKKSWENYGIFFDFSQNVPILWKMQNIVNDLFQCGYNGSFWLWWRTQTTDKNHRIIWRKIPFFSNSPIFIFWQNYSHFEKRFPYFSHDFW